MMQKFITYQLGIIVRHAINITIRSGRTFEFPTGIYIYTGSARRAIQARIQRHLRDDKKLFWHIDYLLVHREVSVTAVRLSEAKECRVNQSTTGTVIRNFGSTDCEADCGGHLRHQAEQTEPQFSSLATDIFLATEYAGLSA